jgi:hypothetical protein
VHALNRDSGGPPCVSATSRSRPRAARPEGGVRQLFLRCRIRYGRPPSGICTPWVSARNNRTAGAICARFDHPIETGTAGDAILLAQVDPGPTVEGCSTPSPVKVAKFFADPEELGQGDEPSLDTTPASYQIEYATC